MLKVFNFIIKYSLYGLVLLMPLFWLPWAVEVYEFNKQYLLVGLVALALLAWLAKMIIVQKKIVFRRTPLDIFVLAFMLVMILAAVFSVDKVSSWLGFYGRFSDSLIGLLALCLMYFLIIQNSKVKIQNYLKLFLASASLVIMAAYLSIFGLWSKIPGLPSVMNLKTFNPVSASLEGLSIFLVMAISLAMGLLLNPKQNQKSKIKNPKIFYYLLIIASVILLVMIDFWAAWLTLAIVMFLLLIMAVWRRLFRQRVNVLILPIILLAIAGVGWLTDFDKKLVENVFKDSLLPQEVILDYQTANSITNQVIKERPILGSGPATFFIDFTKFKPIEFNETRFWNIRFDRAPNHLMEMVGISGILGILSYLILIGVFLLVNIVFLSREKSAASAASYPISDSRHPIFIFSLPLILAWLSLLVGQFVYPQNTVLSFSFWFFMALIIVAWQRIQDRPLKKISFSFKKLPEVGLVMSVLLLILAFAFVALVYLGGRFYGAEFKISQPTADNQEMIKKLERAVNLNSYRENYRRALSQVYLISAWAESRKPLEEQKIQLLQAYASGAVQQARLATTLSPNSVSPWENLGIIYRDSRGLVGGTLPFASEAFAQASVLEPNNPIFFRERCRIDLISQEEDLDETLAFCQKAVDLKSNYLDAHIQLALVYEKKGALEEAVKQLKGALEKLKGVSFQRGSALAGAAAEIYFQLGRVHFNLNQIDEAIKMFEQSVIVMPQYANSRYGLGLSYQVKERFEDALIQFQIINQIVPNNEEVMARIQVLQGQLQSIEEE